VRKEATDGRLWCVLHQPGKDRQRRAVAAPVGASSEKITVQNEPTALRAQADTIAAAYIAEDDPELEPILRRLGRGGLISSRQGNNSDALVV